MTAYTILAVEDNSDSSISFGGAQVYANDALQAVELALSGGLINIPQGSEVEFRVRTSSGLVFKFKGSTNE